MYTILENARIALSLLKEHNIRHIVISPGGSNIPIVQGVQQDPFFTCYSVVDERSAMYFAIGLYLQLGVPIATSCTSAQATRNYIPGLTEAYYKHVPILAITMSKHPMYLGQDYMQCPIQTSLPVDTVKHSYSLPCINTEYDRYQCIRTANEAMLELTHNGNGPVQLNIEELDNQTWKFDDGIKVLPNVRAIKRYAQPDKIGEELSNKRIMLLIGEHRPFSTSEVSAITKFTDSYNVLVYTDHISNFHNPQSINGNIISATSSQDLFENQLCPDILMTIGGLTGDYGIYFKLFNTPESKIEHWRIDLDGRVVDTYNKLTRIYQMSTEYFFRSIPENKANDHSYYEVWRQLYDKMNYSVELPFSNLYAAQQLCQHIPDQSIMHFAILNSLRTWSLMPLNESIQTFSNVAAFGIDGCLSTIVGQSVATNQLCFHITGDLSFYYDMNALGIRHIKNNLRILLVNNNGGAEFKLSSLQEKTDVSTYIAADNHFKTAKGWAETNNFNYISAHNKEEFNANVAMFTSQSEKPILFELFTNSNEEKIANQTFITSNWHGLGVETYKRRMKDSVKQILGDKVINAIKSMK